VNPNYQLLVGTASVCKDDTFRKFRGVNFAVVAGNSQLGNYAMQVASSLNFNGTYVASRNFASVNTQYIISNTTSAPEGFKLTAAIGGGFVRVFYPVFLQQPNSNTGFDPQYIQEASANWSVTVGSTMIAYTSANAYSSAYKPFLTRDGLSSAVSYTANGGFALNNFRQSSIEPITDRDGVFFEATWDRGLYTFDLGILAPGESKIVAINSFVSTDEDSWYAAPWTS
jgi:hypothetical protein